MTSTPARIPPAAAAAAVLFTVLVTLTAYRLTDPAPCREVYPSADDAAAPIFETFPGIGYDGPTGLWTTPDGVVIGHSDHEDGPVLSCTPPR